MKNLLVRWGLALSLMGGVWMVPALTGGSQAIALSEDQVLQKLRQVPVFTITNADGAPLVAAVPNNQTGSNAQNNQNATSVAGVFISRNDAQAFVDNLKSKNPQLGNTVRVTPVSLAEIYKMAQANRDKPERIVFDIIPVKQQVDSALAMLRQDGKQVSQFPGVPLFFASGGKDRGYLTIQRGNEQAIPFFFNKDDLQAMLDRYRQQQPNSIPQVSIQVINLEQLVQTMKNGNDQELNKIVLVPPKETLEYLRTLAPSQPNQNRPSNPQPRR